MLIAISGGNINGVVVSMCLRVDATTGGTDFIAISRKSTGKRTTSALLWTSCLL
ncbi:MAG: YitT family protein [Oribacterium sp.]|nr:YitT family protein [Oribacterium sp.]